MASRAKLQKGLSKLRSYSEMLTDMLADDDQEAEGTPSNGSLSRLSISGTAAPKQSRCTQPACRRSFSLLETPRVCPSCTRQFCRACTAYRRRLSKTGDPDPLGELRHVCRSCLEAKDNEIHCTSHSRTFRDHRNKFKDMRRARRREAAVGCVGVALEPIPGCLDKPDPKEIADRLAQGFLVASKSGWITGLVSEIVVPDWQKAVHWRRAADVGTCEGCGGGMGLFRRKINCRTCGHVFCADCTKEQVLVYVTEEGGAKWAINGREGGPASRPRHFEAMPVCEPCCRALETVIAERLFPKDPEEPRPLPSSGATEFTDSLVALQKKLMTLKDSIEDSLPQYMYLVDVVDRCTVEQPSGGMAGHSATHRLAGLQYELGQLFSQLAVSSQRLKALEPPTPAQRRLLQQVIAGIFHYYSENVFLFRSHRQRLGQHMSEESLLEMKAEISKRSMSNVCVVLYQLRSEGEGLISAQHFSGLTWDLLRSVQEVSMMELREAMEKLQPGIWEDHYSQIVTLGKDSSMKYRLNLRSGDLSQIPAIRSYTIIVKALPALHSCRRYLMITSKVDFPKTKSSLLDLVNLFQMVYTHLLFLYFSYKGQSLQCRSQLYGPLIAVVPMCMNVCESELKALMSLLTWEQYRSEIESLRKFWAANPSKDPLERDATSNPYFGPIQFISKELQKFVECAENLNYCKENQLVFPKTRAVLKDMAESLTLLKSKSILSYALFGFSRLVMEYNSVEKQCSIDSSTILPVVHLVNIVKDELKNKMGPSQWAEHQKEMMEYLKACTQTKQPTGTPALSKSPPEQQKIWKYLVASNNLLVLSDISSFLDTLTAEHEFPDIKSSLKIACGDLKGMTAALQHDLQLDA